MLGGYLFFKTPLSNPHPQNPTLGFIQDLTVYEFYQNHNYVQRKLSTDPHQSDIRGGVMSSSILQVWLPFCP